MLKGKIKPEKEYKLLNIQSDGSEKNPSEYSITFRINNKCNLKCDYCHWHNGDNYSLLDIKNTIDKIIEFSKVKKFKVITFYFHGGEPSFHPDILEILDYINSYNSNILKILIEFQTNLSLDDYSKFYDKVTYFSVSYHYLELKKRNRLDNFYNNIFKLPKNKLLNLDIMLENVENSEYLYSQILDFLELPFINSEMLYGFCHYKYNIDTKNKHLDFYNKYNKNEQTYLIDNKVYNTNDLFKEGLNCKGMKCDAGKNTIVINGDGNIFICGVDMTNYTNRCIDTESFANLLTDELAVLKWKLLSQVGFLCKWEYCGGDFYLKREKYEGNLL